MSMIELTSHEQAIVQSELAAIFISLELSRSSWVVTSLSPGAGERMSRIQLAAGDMGALKEKVLPTAIEVPCALEAGLPIGRNSGSGSRRLFSPSWA